MGGAVGGRDTAVRPATGTNTGQLAGGSSRRWLVEARNAQSSLLRWP